MGIAAVYLAVVLIREDAAFSSAAHIVAAASAHFLVRMGVRAVSAIAVGRDAGSGMARSAINACIFVQIGAEVLRRETAIGDVSVFTQGTAAGVGLIAVGCESAGAELARNLIIAPGAFNAVAGVGNVYIIQSTGTGGCIATGGAGGSVGTVIIICDRKITIFRLYIIANCAGASMLVIAGWFINPSMRSYP